MECCWLNWKAADEDISKMEMPLPAMTYKVVIENNMPVAVPTCLQHFLIKQSPLHVVP